MKNYILKLIIFFAVLFLFFELTIGKRLDKFENTVNSFKNNEQEFKSKKKLRLN